MTEQQLPKMRLLGKLEEISAVAHDIDFFTNTGLSVHYKLLQPSPITNLQGVIYVALAEVLRLHPILFAVPTVGESKEAYWGRLPSIDVTKVVSFIDRKRPSTTASKGRDQELDKLLEDQHNTSFKHGYGTLPVWRLIILNDFESQNGFMACFIAHHSMSDGVGSQIFQNSFQKALCLVSNSPPSLQSGDKHIVCSKDDDAIAPSLEELHPLPLPTDPPTPSTDIITNEWTGTPVQLPCKTRYVSLSFSPQHAKSFAQECRKHKVAPTAAIPALIAKLLYDNLDPSTDSLICNLPVSLRGDLPPKTVDGAMGNYIDAFKVKLLKSNISKIAGPQEAVQVIELWTHARKIQDETRKYFGNVSPSGEPYTNIAFFKLFPDLRAALQSTLGGVRGESFEVSNLGTFPQIAMPKTGPVWQAGKVLVSRCAYAAGGPLVVCVLSGTENIGFGFTWPEGAVADEIVEKVVEGVRVLFTASL